MRSWYTIVNTPPIQLHFVDKEIDKITTTSNTEIHHLSSQLEDMTMKWDKVEQYKLTEKALNKELEDT